MLITYPFFLDLYIYAKKQEHILNPEFNASIYKTKEWKEDLLLKLSENSNIRQNFISHILTYRKNELYIYVDCIDRGIEPIPRGYLIIRKIKSSKQRIDYYLPLLCVKSCDRRHGIGKKMIQEITDKLYHYSIPSYIYLHSISHNVDKFYMKCGFEECSLDECERIQRIESIDIGDVLFVYCIEPKHSYLHL